VRIVLALQKFVKTLTDLSKVVTVGASLRGRPSLANEDSIWKDGASLRGRPSLANEDPIWKDGAPTE